MDNFFWVFQVRGDQFTKLKSNLSFSKRVQFHSINLWFFLENITKSFTQPAPNKFAAKYRRCRISIKRMYYIQWAVQNRAHRKFPFDTHNIQRITHNQAKTISFRVSNEMQTIKQSEMRESQY